jgi:hypothetical protein
MFKHIVFPILFVVALVVSSSSRVQAAEGDQWKVTWYDTIQQKPDEYVCSSQKEAENYRDTHLLGVATTNLQTGKPAYIDIKIIPPGGKSKEDEAKKAAKDAKDKYEEAKKAAKDAKEINKEQPVGGVLQEYKDRIADAYKRTTDAKNTLVDTTGTIAKDDFRRVNGLIASYNRDAGDFNIRASNAGLDSVPTIASVTPSDLKGKLDSDKAASKGKYDVWVFKMENGNWAKQEDRTLATDDAEQARDYVEKVKAVEGWTATTNAPEAPIVDLKGTTWEVASSYDNLSTGHSDENATWTFLPSGEWKDSGRELVGKWTQDGARVGLTWDNGKSFSSWIKGDEMTGDANLHNGYTHWKWSAKKK